MARTSPTLLLLWLCASCTAGDADDSSGGGTSDGADTSGAADDATTEGVAAVPTDAAAMTAWLADDGYAGWSAETAAHASTGPHGRVLTFFNDDLVASFDGGNTTHPVGSASVKELLADDDNVTGWAVMVKTAAGDDAASWYWYLAMGDSVSAEGNGLGTCDGCHAATGIDRVLTPYPLQ